MKALPPGPGEQAYTYRKLYVCLARADWDKFADALYDAFPDARYFFNPPVFYRMWPDPPPIMQGEHMLQMSDSEGPIDPRKQTEAEMHFDPHWHPRWIVTGDPINDMLPEPGAYWDLTQPRLPAFRFEFSFEKSEAKHPPHLSVGEYWFFFAPGDQSHMAIGRKVFRLFRQVATNRDQVELRRDGSVVRRRRVSPIWLGHDAIRWAKEDSSRQLAYFELTDPCQQSGVRPLD